MNEYTETNTQDTGKSDISSPKNEQPKKKMCVLTKILIGCFLALISTCFSAMFISSLFEIDNDILGMAMVVFLSTILVALPFLAIASLIRISLNPDRLRGKVITILLLAISCFFVFEIFVMQVPAAHSRFRLPMRVICGTNLKGLGTALEVYAYDHDGMLPSDNWCDCLIEEADISPRSLQCPEVDSVEGESDYYLNKYAAGKKLSELPDDMVLLFESNFIPVQDQIRMPIQNREGFSDLKVVPDIFPRGDEKVYLNKWNQVGGPELLAYDRHEEGCNILFANGEAKYVKQPDLHELRWKVEDDASFALPAPSKPEENEPAIFTFKTVSLAVLGLACVSVTVLILIRYKAAEYGLFVVILAVLSAATGLFFGKMSEQAYIIITGGSPGAIAGALIGVLGGACFTVILMNCSENKKRLKRFWEYSAYIGMIMGVVCSTVVHIALMIVNKEANPFGIVIGIPYGIFAGAMLGLISGVIVKRFYREKVSVEIKNQE